MKTFSVCHISLDCANLFVAAHHRHHKPVVGHRFSLGAVVNGQLVGVAIVGRPVARPVDHTQTVEVTRCCTDGTPNACSFLYGACARAAKALGFSTIQTYILDAESGTSLRAAGWAMLRHTQGRQWKHTDGKPRRTDQPTCTKALYAKTLSGAVQFKLPPALIVADEPQQFCLFSTGAC